MYVRKIDLMVATHSHMKHIWIITILTIILNIKLIIKFQLTKIHIYTQITLIFPRIRIFTTLEEILYLQIL